MFISIKNKFVIFITLLLISSFCIVGFVQFQTTFQKEKENINLLAQTSLKPIILSAKMSVAGANIMKLKSKDFKILYKTSEALYIKIDGMSNKIPKSLFAPEQPPKNIKYEYKSKNISLKCWNL